MVGVDARIVALIDAKPFVKDGQKGFVDSLLLSYDKYGKLSEKQWYWVEKIVHDLKADKEPKPDPVVVCSNGIAGVKALLDTGHSKLKHPGLWLKLPDGREVAISRAGDSSKNPGMIYVKINHTYVGKIDAKGEFHAAGGFNPEVGPPTFDELFKLLEALGNDPAGVAAEYGKIHGACCFCGKELEEAKSVAVGYGPTCAKNYGLPYGVAAAAAANAGIKPAKQMIYAGEDGGAHDPSYGSLPKKPEPKPEPVQLPLDLDGLIHMVRGGGDL